MFNVILTDQNGQVGGHRWQTPEQVAALFKAAVELGGLISFVVLREPGT